MPARRSRMLVVLFVAVAMLAGCGRRQTSRSGTAHQLKKSEMTVAEQKYGVAPTPDPTVTYQPDVIVVGGGADAIRAQSPNGFIWTIDAGAPHAADLVAGKVMFLTNRAVGRVLDVRQDGGNLVVVVGPVNLTDVVREAHIEIDMPIDFGEAIAYTSPDLPGQVSVARLSIAGDAAVTPVAFVRDSGSADDTQDAAAPGSDVSKLVNFRVIPFANSSGIGLEAGSDKGDLTLYARATVFLAKPTFKAVVDITPSAGLTEASLSLGGAAGLNWKFAVGTKVGRSANVSGYFEPATDFSIPVGGAAGLPIAVTVRQIFRVQTALGVRNATLSATGDYTFKGAFTIGYIGNQWTIGGPTGFSATTNMMKTADGISLGASGIDLTDQVRVIAGLGVHGFAVGPYFSLTSAAGVFKGSSAGMIECKEATIDVKLSGGVGYQIPKVVANLINSVLRALNIKYSIDNAGGLRSGEPLTIVSDTSTMKGCHADKGN